MGGRQGAYRRGFGDHLLWGLLDDWRCWCAHGLSGVDKPKQVLHTRAQGEVRAAPTNTAAMTGLYLVQSAGRPFSLASTRTATASQRASRSRSRRRCCRRRLLLLLLLRRGEVLGALPLSKPTGSVIVEGIARLGVPLPANSSDVELAKYRQQ